MIDFYRLQAETMHMTGKNIYSIETAPEMKMEEGMEKRIQEIINRPGKTFCGIYIEHLQVEKGRLNIQGPAYGALLFDRQKTLPYEVVKKLLVYSKAGFPIIFLREAPDGTIIPERASDKRNDGKLVGKR